MPRRCNICAHARTAEITRAIAAGDSFRTLASRFGVSSASLQRHATSCLRVARKQTASPPASSSSKAADSSRLASAAPIATRDDLLEKVRALFVLGDLLEEAYAAKNVDACVKLAREYRAAAETFAKIAGWVTEGSTTLIDARRQTVEILGRFSEAELHALAGRGVDDNVQLSGTSPSAVSEPLDAIANASGTDAGATVEAHTTEAPVTSGATSESSG